MVFDIFVLPISDNRQTSGDRVLVSGHSGLPQRCLTHVMVFNILVLPISDYRQAFEDRVWLKRLPLSCLAFSLASMGGGGDGKGVGKLGGKGGGKDDGVLGPAPPSYPPPASVAAGDAEGGGGGDDGGGGDYEHEDPRWIEEEAAEVWICIRGGGDGGKGKGKGNVQPVIHYFDGGFWSGTWVSYSDDKGKGKATTVMLTRDKGKGMGDGN